MTIKKTNKDCLRGGCERWYYNQTGPTTVWIEDCWRCGFNVLENERRQKIPLTLCEDGLRRKIIPAKPSSGEVKEVGEK